MKMESLRKVKNESKSNVVDFKNWQMERKKFVQFQDKQQIDNSTPGDFLARLARLSNDDPETFNKIKRLVYAMLCEST